jgi:alpha-amylase/alpha-mannosidase (GH57 family)
MVTFLFAVHNHQPVGNFEFVLEKAFRDSYLPFLREAKEHPAFRWTLHFSGPLWEHMVEKERECWDIVGELAQEGRVELLGGGFYEPILSLISAEDKLGQVEMMNRFLEENFGTRPRGAWLAERVWEPHLAKPLARAGIEYSLLDEEHFLYAGVKNIHTSYITEEEGLPLRLFPIDKKLRYLIPFRGLDEIRAYFEEIGGQSGTAILGDDGEKFGLWPGTHKWVYEEGWLKAFLAFLEKENIRTATFSEYLDEHPPAGRVYLPPASYEEMMGWVLDPEEHEIFETLKGQIPPQAKRFLRGGFFRDFLLKYPESNHLHKRMFLVSRELGKKHDDEEARRQLYRAQGNDPYWHGIFGGLYLPHLRGAAYRHLLLAEEKLNLEPGWQRLDYDLDGRDEYLRRGEEFNLIIKPSFGGSIVEIDDRTSSRNISDVLSRRRESYLVAREDKKGEGRSIHELAREIPPEAEELLHPDWYPRFSALDHFLPPGTTRDSFRRVDFSELGDFINQKYNALLTGDNLVLEREGSVRIGDQAVSVRVKKTIRPVGRDIRVAYEIENLSVKDVGLLFGSEWNFSFFPEETEFGEPPKVIFLKSVGFDASQPDEFWHFPLQTLSQSEEGYDIIVQGICLLPLWSVTLNKGGKFLAEVRINRTNDR